MPGRLRATSSLKPGERPYMKYAQSGDDTIHVAYTNAHPNEFPSVNVYYARVRAGKIERANGTEIGTLDAPIAPEAGDEIFDEAEPSWVQTWPSTPRAAGDRVRLVPEPGGPSLPLRAGPGARGRSTRSSAPADLSGVMAARPTTRAGSRSTTRIPPACTSRATSLPARGRSRRGRRRTVVELTTAVVSTATEKNVRPISPRGMSAFDDDLGVIWMRGAYPDYENYETEVAALTG